VLFFSAGLTRTKPYPGGEEMRFRAAPSTVALYQTEVYVVAGAVEALGAGVYDFSPGDFRLRRLRAGDSRGALPDASGEPPLAGPSPATPAGPPGAPGLPPASAPVLPRSSGEVDYPALRELHAASVLDTPEAVQVWRQGGPLPAPTPRGRTVALPPPRPAAGRGLGETILRRASTRQFSHEPLTAVELSTALAAATAPMAADGPGPLVWLYLIV